MKRKISAVLALVLIGGLFLPMQQASSKKHKPTLAQIEAAKKVEAEKKKVANAALKRLQGAQGNLRALSAIASDARAYFHSLAFLHQHPVRLR